MGEPLSQIPIVGQEQQAFTPRIETADVEKPYKIGRQQIKDRVAGVRITTGRNKTGGFMKCNRQLALNVHQSPVYFDMVPVAGLRAEISADLPVNRDPPGGDQLIALAPRSNSRGGQKTIQPHGWAG
jgi:hypothetical protein